MQVPADCTRYPELAAWLAVQREAVVSSALSPARTDQLIAIGAVVTSSDGSDRGVERKGAGSQYAPAPALSAKAVEAKRAVAPVSTMV